MVRWMLQLFVILGCLIGQTTFGIADDSPDFKSQVASILASKCLRCHGESRAENDFRVDEVDQLEAFISAKDLEASSLWTDYVTTDDEDLKMPPVNEPQLSEAELETVKQWILTSGEVVAIENWAALDSKDEAVRKTDDLTTALWVLLGRFHPALVHFPIALLTVAAFFALLAFGNEHMSKAAIYCLVLGSLGSIAAVAAGWGFADYSQWGDWKADAIGSSKWQHRWGGVGVAVLACLVTTMAFYARNNPDRGQFFWKLGTLILAGMVGWVGHEGGELHYGDIYSAPVNRVQELLQKQFNGAEAAKGGDTTPVDDKAVTEDADSNKGEANSEKVADPAPKTEASKAEDTLPETKPGVDAPKEEGLKAETAEKKEEANSESGNIEPAKVDAGKADAAKKDAVKVEQEKVTVEGDGTGTEQNSTAGSEKKDDQ